MIRDSIRLVSVPTSHGDTEIPLSSVLWIDGSADMAEGVCHIHTTEEVLESNVSFEKLLHLMGDSFLFCLERGAVNMHRVVQMEEDFCLLDNGMHLAVTPFLASRIKEAWCRYVCRKVWES